MFSALRSVSALWIGEGNTRRTTLVIAAGVVVLAFVLGQRASPLWLGLLAAGLAIAPILAQPLLIPLALAARGPALADRV